MHGSGGGGGETTGRKAGIGAPPPTSRGPSFAESPQNERPANGAKLAGARRCGKRSDRLAVAMPTEQHDEIDAAFGLLQFGA
jgi:hypothetical protein